MPQLFRLQIAFMDGTVVNIPPGGPLEVALVDECVKAISAKGIGFLKSEATVKAAIREGICDVVTALKQRTLEAM